MKKFEHLILCRYNCGLYSSNIYKVKNPNDWMDNRIVKFINLLKSLKNQVCKNYKLYIFIDEKTPEYQIDILLNKINDFLEESKFEITTGHPIKYIQDLDLDSEYIITSRIDNDDEYTPNFIKSIQDCFNEEEEVLDVIGIQLDVINSKKYTSGRSIPNSPFVSLVEKNIKPIKTVFCKQHSHMPKFFKNRFVDNKEPLYIQNIHDNNIMNKIVGKPID